MTLDVERIVDSSVRLQETLCRSSALEPLHFPLSPSDRQMRILSAIVVAQSTTVMSIAETKSLERRAVGTKPISDDPLRFNILILQQPPQHSNSSASVAAFLHDHVHDLAFVIDCAPDPHTIAGNRRHDLIKMPPRRRRELSPSEIRGDLRSELHCPGPDCFVAHVDAPLGEHLFNVAQTEREAEV
jgi:hypothetical protein